MLHFVLLVVFGFAVLSVLNTTWLENGILDTLYFS